MMPKSGEMEGALIYPRCLSRSYTQHSPFKVSYMEVVRGEFLGLVGLLGSVGYD